MNDERLCFYVLAPKYFFSGKYVSVKVTESLTTNEKLIAFIYVHIFPILCWMLGCVMGRASRNFNRVRYIRLRANRPGNIINSSLLPQTPAGSYK